MKEKIKDEKIKDEKIKDEKIKDIVLEYGCLFWTIVCLITTTINIIIGA